MRHFIGLTYIKSFNKRIETALLQSHVGVKNANAQFKATDEVKIDKTGNWWNDNVYSKDWTNWRYICNQHKQILVEL